MTASEGCTCPQDDVLVTYYGEHYVVCSYFEPSLTHAERRELRKLLASECAATP